MIAQKQVQKIIASKKYFKGIIYLVKWKKESLQKSKWILATILSSFPQYEKMINQWNQKHLNVQNIYFDSKITLKMQKFLFPSSVNTFTFSAIIGKAIINKRKYYLIVLKQQPLQKAFWAPITTRLHTYAKVARFNQKIADQELPYIDKAWIMEYQQRNQLSDKKDQHQLVKKSKRLIKKTTQQNLNKLIDKILKKIESIKTGLQQPSKPNFQTEYKQTDIHTQQIKLNDSVQVLKKVSLKAKKVQKSILNEKFKILGKINKEEQIKEHPKAQLTSFSKPETKNFNKNQQINEYSLDDSFYDKLYQDLAQQNQKIKCILKSTFDTTQRDIKPKSSAVNLSARQIVKIQPGTEDEPDEKVSEKPEYVNAKCILIDNQFNSKITEKVIQIKFETNVIRSEEYKLQKQSKEQNLYRVEITDKSLGFFVLGKPLGLEELKEICRIVERN